MHFRQSIGIQRTLRRVHIDVIELNWIQLNWHGLVFAKLANGKARRIHWSLV